MPIPDDDGKNGMQVADNLMEPPGERACLHLPAIACYQASYTSTRSSQLSPELRFGEPCYACCELFLKLLRQSYAACAQRSVKCVMACIRNTVALHSTASTAYSPRYESSPILISAVIGYVEDSTSLFPEDSRNIGSSIPQQLKHAMDGQSAPPVPPSPTRHSFKSKRRHKHDKQSVQSRDTLSTPQRAVSPQLPPETISNDMSVRIPPFLSPYLLPVRHWIALLRLYTIVGTTVQFALRDTVRA